MGTRYRGADHTGAGRCLEDIQRQDAVREDKMDSAYGQVIQNRVDVVRRNTEQVLRRYDGENDTIPGAPSVTWADRQLVDMVITLTKAIQELQSQINFLQTEVYLLKK